MIIDAHTHIYPQNVASKAINKIINNTNGRLHAYTEGTLESLHRSMDEAGVDFSLVLTVATRPGQGAGILKWIESTKHLSHRLLFFSSVHPLDAKVKEIIKETKAMGLQGVKFHPAYQGFPADSEDALHVYEQILNQDLAIYFHAGVDMSLPTCDFTSVERFARVLSCFDRSKIILAHGGGFREWDKVLDLLGDKKCYYDVAFVLEDMKKNEQAKEHYLKNEDFFLFGTDSPWQNQKDYVEMIRTSTFLSKEQKDKLFFKNIQKLIKIP